jgi:hypothetical protein
MKPKILFAMLMLGSFFVSGIVTAQANKQNAVPEKKLYRWVDKDGKTQISDTMPPELAGQARKEFNSKGNSTSTVARTLTEEERATQSVKNEQQAIADKEAANQKRLEEAMLISYQSEDELRRIYKERMDLLQQTIESTDISIKSIRGSLADMLSQASENELKKRKVDDKRVTSMKELHEELLKQQVSQIERKVDIKSLEAEFDKVLARYRDLRGTADAAASNTPATAPNTAAPATPSK